MEIDNIDENFINYLLEENQKVTRNYQNSKMMNEQIYQNDDIIKIKSDNNKYYENQEFQNNSINNLISCSNFISYNTDNNCKSIYEAKQKIKNNFNKIYIADKNSNSNNNEFKNELNGIKDKIFEKNFKENNEYKNLYDLINQDDFDEKMKNDEEFRISIFLNKFFMYNEKSKEIIKKYSHLLPNYIYNIIKEKFENNKDNLF